MLARPRCAQHAAVACAVPLLHAMHVAASEDGSAPAEWSRDTGWFWHVPPTKDQCSGGDRQHVAVRDEGAGTALTQELALHALRSDAFFVSPVDSF